MSNECPNIRNGPRTRAGQLVDGTWLAQKSSLYHDQKSPGSHTCKIIPVREWLVTPMYEPFGSFGRGTTLLNILTMVINQM